MTADDINTISSIALVVVTTIYAIFTYLILRHTKNYNDKQMNLMTLPYLMCEIKRDGTGRYQYIISLINHGDFPAYDVEILIMGVFYASNDEINMLNSKYIRKGEKFNVNKFNVNNKEEYGIFELLKFPILPAKKQIIENIEFSICPVEELKIFVQYRNALKTNYGQIFEFITLDRKGLTQLPSEQDYTAPLPRLKINWIEKSNSFGLILQNNKKIPESITKFSENLSHSVSINHFIEGSSKPHSLGGTIRDWKI